MLTTQESTDLRQFGLNHRNVRDFIDRCEHRTTRNHWEFPHFIPPLLGNDPVRHRVMAVLHGRDEGSRQACRAAAIATGDYPHDRYTPRGRAMVALVRAHELPWSVFAAVTQPWKGGRAIRASLRLTQATGVEVHVAGVSPRESPSVSLGFPGFGSYQRMSVDVGDLGAVLAWEQAHWHAMRVAALNAGFTRGYTYMRPGCLLWRDELLKLEGFTFTDRLTRRRQQLVLPPLPPDLGHDFCTAHEHRHGAL